MVEVVVGAIATVAAAAIGALLAPWWTRKLSKRDLGERAVSADAHDLLNFASLPISVQDPWIQEATRQWFLEARGRPPTRQELYDVLNATVVHKSVHHVSGDELDGLTEGELP